MLSRSRFGAVLLPAKETKNSRSVYLSVAGQGDTVPFNNGIGTCPYPPALSTRMLLSLLVGKSLAAPYMPRSFWDTKDLNNAGAQIQRFINGIGRLFELRGTTSGQE